MASWMAVCKADHVRVVPPAEAVDAASSVKSMTPETLVVPRGCQSDPDSIPQVCLAVVGKQPAVCMVLSAWTKGIPRTNLVVTATRRSMQRKLAVEPTLADAVALTKLLVLEEDAPSIFTASAFGHVPFTRFHKS